MSERPFKVEQWSKGYARACPLRCRETVKIYYGCLGLVHRYVLVLQGMIVLRQGRRSKRQGSQRHPDCEQPLTWRHVRYVKRPQANLPIDRSLFGPAERLCNNDVEKDVSEPKHRKRVSG
jgi:hypothetical protein